MSDPAIRSDVAPTVHASAVLHGAPSGYYAHYPGGFEYRYERLELPIEMGHRFHGFSTSRGSHWSRRPKEGPRSITSRSTGATPFARRTGNARSRAPRLRRKSGRRFRRSRPTLAGAWETPGSEPNRLVHPFLAITGRTRSWTTCALRIVVEDDLRGGIAAYPGDDRRAVGVALDGRLTALGHRVRPSCRAIRRSRAVPRGPGGSARRSRVRL